jgi:hypothetical protein
MGLHGLLQGELYLHIIPDGVGGRINLYEFQKPLKISFAAKYYSVTPCLCIKTLSHTVVQLLGAEHLPQCSGQQ